MRMTTTHCGLAARYGHLPVVQFLAEHWALTAEDARTCDNDALWMSCANGHLPVVQSLAEHWGLTAEDARANDNYALRRNCWWGHLVVVQSLAEHWGLTAEDARACDNDALRMSCANGHLPVVQLLAEHWGSLRRMRVRMTSTHCGRAGGKGIWCSSRRKTGGSPGDDERTDTARPVLPSPDS